MELAEAVAIIDKHIPDAKVGLPDDVFYLVSRTTPLINVDLLIKDENGRTLLSWRDDKYSGTGWHIPGGIIRFKESFETRIQKVALSEVGYEVDYKKENIALNEIFNDAYKNRGHFISLLYDCFLSSELTLNRNGLTEGEVGFCKWFDECPDNLIHFHDIYRKFM